MKNILLLSLIVLVGLSSCRKELNDFQVTVEEEEPTTYVVSSIRGKVLTENGTPLPGVSVQVENERLTSDAQGFFHFKKLLLKKSGASVQAKLPNYFEGISRANVSADGTSFVEIRMMEKGEAEVIDPMVANSFTTADGVKIAIPANAIADLNGADYNGNVHVQSRWIDPTDEKMAGIMPGELTAKDENGNPLALISYGMLAFELETESGEELMLKTDAKVEVEMPIPDELQNDAPTEVPLWYFDLEEEQWLLSDACQKEGAFYHCVIVKTGYWNCDVAVPAICLSGQILNSDSTASSYLKVVVEDLTDNFVYWGYTDSLGYFCGSVPQDALLRLTLVDHCDNEVYTADIGPFETDFMLETIILNTVVEEFVIGISGTLSHCISTDVPNGHVAVSYPGRIRIFPFEAGGFDINLGLKCVEFPDLKIRAYSNSEAQATAEIIHSNFEDIDIGQEQTCEDLSDFFNLSVDGVDYWTAPTQFYLKDNETTNWMVLEGLSGAGTFTIDISNFVGVGTYTDDIQLKIENDLPLPDYPVLQTTSPNVTVVILTEIEDLISGTIAGNAVNASGATVEITGDFMIKKAP